MTYTTSGQMIRRFERKFYIPYHKINRTVAMLSHHTRVDLQFPTNQVQSVYYDTDDLEMFYTSLDGSRVRKKVRIRWYDRPSAGHANIFVEVKCKDGLAGTKYRRCVEIDHSRIFDACWASGIVPYDRLLGILVELGFMPHRPIYPLVMVRYKRQRFTEITTGLRLSIDTQIESWAIDRWGISVAPHVRLAGGVLEIKGPWVEVPPTLCWIRQMGLDWSRYSKYAACLEAHMGTPGTIGITMPSGRIESISF